MSLSESFIIRYNKADKSEKLKLFNEKYKEKEEKLLALAQNK